MKRALMAFGLYALAAAGGCRQPAANTAAGESVRAELSGDATGAPVVFDPLGEGSGVSPTPRGSAIVTPVASPCVNGRSEGGPCRSPGLDYALTIDDPGQLVQDAALVRASFDAAMRDWARYIHGRHGAVLKIIFSIRPDKAGGKTFSALSPHTWAENRVDAAGMRVGETAAAYKLRTGGDVTTARDPYDIRITANPEHFTKRIYFDPDPEHRLFDTPPGKSNFISTIEHELGHAFGISSVLGRKTGEPNGGEFISVYDEFILASAQSGAPEFVGAAAMAVYGGPVPVFFQTHDDWNFAAVRAERAHPLILTTASNFSHYGRFRGQSDESEQTFFGLMAGARANRDPRRGDMREIQPLDVAILKDLGVPINGEPDPEAGAR